jgi:hypothetical protein
VRAAQKGREPAEIVRVEPGDGAARVFRDTPVVAWLSHPADPASLSAEAFRVEDPERGRVASQLWLSPDARLLVWRPEEPLRPGALHFVLASGLRDRRGRTLAPWISRFRTCDITRPQLLGGDPDFVP